MDISTNKTGILDRRKRKSRRRKLTQLENQMRLRALEVVLTNMASKEHRERSVVVPALSDVPSTEELTRMFRGDKHSTFLGAIVDSIGLKGQESLGRTGTLATRIDHVLARFLERLSLGQHIPMPRIVERFLLEEHIIRLTVVNVISNLYSSIQNVWQQLIGSPLARADALWVNKLRAQYDRLWSGGITSILSADGLKSMAKQRFRSVWLLLVSVGLILSMWRMMYSHRLSPMGRLRMYTIPLPSPPSVRFGDYRTVGSMAALSGNVGRSMYGSQHW